MKEMRMAVAKVAISLPSEVVDQIEAARSETGQSRSQFVLNAVQAYLIRRQAAAEAQAYAKGYELFPEIPEEEGAYDELSAAVLAQEPWG